MNFAKKAIIGVLAALVVALCIFVFCFIFAFSNNTIEVSTHSEETFLQVNEKKFNPSEMQSDGTNPIGVEGSQEPSSTGQSSSREPSQNGFLNVIDEPGTNKGNSEDLFGSNTNADNNSSSNQKPDESGTSDAQAGDDKDYSDMFLGTQL